jgi:hypothetical protein
MFRSFVDGVACLLGIHTYIHNTDMCEVASFIPSKLAWCSCSQLSNLKGLIRKYISIHSGSTSLQCVHDNVVSNIVCHVVHDHY